MKWTTCSKGAASVTSARRIGGRRICRLLAAHGLPTPDELKLLEPFRAKLPPELFTDEFKPPVTDGSGDNRDNMRKAADLLKEAGWTLKDGKLVNAKGEPFKFEIIEVEPM